MVNMLLGLLGWVILLSVPGTAVAWLWAEYRLERKWRITLGIATTVLFTVLISFVTYACVQLNYNSWYGGASKDLIDMVTERLEAGDTETVASELKKLQADFKPTYENSADYLELTRAAVDRLRAEN